MELQDITTLSPQYIDEYKIIGRLGKGGMGVVYKVARSPGEIYALKILLDKEIAEENYIYRFKKEIEILSKLNHPNIVKVYALGIWQYKPYFVMEYLEGMTLGEYLKTRQKILLKEALSIFYPIASALLEVHNLGIIHRDIKPENIMICNKKPYLLDFGVALEYTRQTRATATGVAIGTLNYMPSEQVEGHRKKIGPWSDIYSLGATMYHALTGVVPFFGHTDFEIMLRLAQEEIPSIKKHNPRFSKDLDWLVYKATRKNPEDRYISMKEFLKDLDCIMNQRKITKKRISSPKRNWIFPGVLFFLVLSIFCIVFLAKQENVSKIIEKKSNITEKRDKQDIAKKKEEFTSIRSDLKDIKILKIRLKEIIEVKIKQLKQSISQNDSLRVIYITEEISNIYRQEKRLFDESEFLKESNFLNAPLMARKFHLHLSIDRYSHAQYDLLCLRTINQLEKKDLSSLQYKFDTILKRDQKDLLSFPPIRQKIKIIFRLLAFIDTARWEFSEPMVLDSWQQILHISKEDFPEFTPFIKCMSSLLALKEKNIEEAQEAMNFAFSGDSLYTGFDWVNSQGKRLIAFWPEVTFMNGIRAYYSKNQKMALIYLSKLKTDKDYFLYPTQSRLYRMAEPYLKSLEDSSLPLIALESSTIKNLLHQMFQLLGDRMLKASEDIFKIGDSKSAIQMCQDCVSLEYQEYFFHYRLGQYHQKNHDFALAESNFYIAKQYRPDWGELNFSLGRLYFDSQRLQQARQCFEDCVVNSWELDDPFAEKSQKYLQEIDEIEKKK